jgi:molecular chaperone GrpE
MKFNKIFRKMDKNEQENTNGQDANTENQSTIENESSTGSNNYNEEKAALEAKIAELNDKYLRLYSEFDNFRKRTIREKQELSKTAGEDAFKSILPVIDDFERALKSGLDTTDVKSIQEGVQLIYNKLKNTLQHKGLEQMESIGKDFDPEVHEAITNVPAPAEDMKGKVIDEVEKGYTLNGKIIRFAKVIVGS